MVPGAEAAADRGRRPGLARLGRGRRAGLVRGHGHLLLLQGGRGPRGRRAAQRPSRGGPGPRPPGQDDQGPSPAGQPHEARLTSRSAVAASPRAGSTHRWRSSAWSYRLGKVRVAPSRIIPFLLPRLLEPNPAERRRVAILLPGPDDRQGRADRAPGRARDRRRGLLGRRPPVAAGRGVPDGGPAPGLDRRCPGAPGAPRPRPGADRHRHAAVGRSRPARATATGICVLLRPAASRRDRRGAGLGRAPRPRNSHPPDAGLTGP